MKDLPKILCVDDEQEVLDGLRLQLRKQFKVLTALGGEKGLITFKENTDCCIVVSDMRMPGMNGAAFLSKIRKIRSEATRLLLTGQSDIDSAMSAINDGHIFRFLMKPCPPEKLKETLQEAYHQYILISGRRALLEKTLNGSIKMLSKVLSISKPLAFGRCESIKRLSIEVARYMGLGNLWELEIAAIFLNLGSISLNDDLILRIHNGEKLDDEEKEQVKQIPEISCSLIRNIPHLEKVGEIIAQVQKGPNEQSLEAKVISVSAKFIELSQTGQRPENIISLLREVFDSKVMQALVAVLEKQESLSKEEIVSLKELSENMIIAEDLHHSNGTILIASGCEVTIPLLNRLRSIGSRNIQFPILVYKSAV